MTMRNRATNAEYETRLDALTGLMKRGHSPSQLVRAACQQWDVSIRQATRYVQAIKEREKERLKQPFEFRLSFLDMHLDFLYEQAVQNKEWELARKVTENRMTLYNMQHRGGLDNAIQPEQPGFTQHKGLEELVRMLEEEGPQKPPGAHQ
jgi:hypothetical protein